MQLSSHSIIRVPGHSYEPLNTRALQSGQSTETLTISPAQQDVRTFRPGRVRPRKPVIPKGMHAHTELRIKI